MAILNKVLVRQLVKMQQRQGSGALLVYLLKVFNYRVINRYFRGSYSQKGEDLMINKLFNSKKRGFYIDVGASHPSRLNNTNLFYQHGWHGINIEPNPERITLFLQDRKRDINLNVGIGLNKKAADFYAFENAALSTFSQKEAKMLLKVGFKLRKKLKVPMFTLKRIIEKYAKGKIDFMTVDVEGMDMEVLKSNDWKKFRPKLLCVETIDFINLLNSGDGKSPRKISIDTYLLKQGYKAYFTNGLNTLYKDSQLAE